MRRAHANSILVANIPESNFKAYALAQRGKLVVPFWHIKTTTKKEEANCDLVPSAALVASAATNITGKVEGAVDIDGKIPVCTNTAPIRKDAELILFKAEEPQKKKARH